MGNVGKRVWMHVVGGRFVRGSVCVVVVVVLFDAVFDATATVFFDAESFFEYAKRRFFDERTVFDVVSVFFSAIVFFVFFFFSLDAATNSLQRKDFLVIIGTGTGEKDAIAEIPAPASAASAASAPQPA